MKKIRIDGFTKDIMETTLEEFKRFISNVPGNFISEYDYVLNTGEMKLDKRKITLIFSTYFKICKRMGHDPTLRDIQRFYYTIWGENDG